ncbi:DUF3632 domain-containing protein [Aspergillus thermomutatus]|uniref:Uncharacterized protein n=1 Tax=Aspergillus thermomutatus TaxID=41047 RepID=A0A397HIA8_ASPTH|nr:uncharacterized protein CDV56_108010 [Aspergillus thermomutatus]RHZ61818.1 hypothetical protein CDV56_108010 [Aspergillus thermomutatus]
MYQLPPNTYKGNEYDLEPHLTVLHDLFADKIHSPEAAAKLASAALALDASLEAQLGQLWHLILQIACKNPEHQDELVDILVDLSHLPDVTRPGDDGQDEPLIIYDMQVWKNLPLLGWEIRRYWDYSIPAPGTKTLEGREAAISSTVNVNHFVALLVATDEPIFEGYSWYALVTLHEALETPWVYMQEGDPLEAWIPAAAAWIEVLGVEIYEWDEEFESGPLVGAPGRGGPLWKGKHGFCKERWKLWRERFGEAAKKEDESEEVRRVAEEAELMMKEIETGHVE